MAQTPIKQRFSSRRTPQEPVQETEEKQEGEQDFGICAVTMKDGLIPILVIPDALCRRNGAFAVYTQTALKFVL